MYVLFYVNNCRKDGFLKKQVDEYFEISHYFYVLEHKYDLVQIEKIFVTESDMNQFLIENGMDKYTKKITKAHFKEYEKAFEDKELFGETITVEVELTEEDLKETEKYYQEFLYNPVK